MNLVRAILADTATLPPIQAPGFEYVLAGNGLFIRAQDARLEALVPIAPATLHGLADVKPYARLKIPRVPVSFLRAVRVSARRFLPREAMYQFAYDAGAPDDLQTRSGWRAGMPNQVMRIGALRFEDFGAAVLDLHSHGTLSAFFSETDDGDEQGLRFYAVIGRLDTDRPGIAVRMGVYGYHYPVPAEMVFEGLGPFVDVLEDAAVAFSVSSDFPKIDG